MNPIRFEVTTPPSRANSGVIRINGEMYTHLTRLSALTRLPIGEIANRLLAEALSAVELVEAPLYDMKFKQEE